MKAKPGTYFLLPLVLLVLLGSCKQQGTEGRGCTDPQSNNLDSEATENDGSCTYDEVWIKPTKSLILSESLRETSGLILWEGSLLTHNDSDDTRLYKLDTINATIQEEYLLEGVESIDWEDIDQDSEYIYLGDFGNNASGNRDDLHILRIQKSTLLLGMPKIDTIGFTYSDQYDMSPMNPNQTEFDCEAFVVFPDGIFLFTKDWIGGRTSIYSIPNIPGDYLAQKISSLGVNGLVTGATALASRRMVILCGYSSLIQPFVILLYDYQGNDFFSGNIRVINLSIPFHLVEAITTIDGLNYFLSNEYHLLPTGVSILQKVHLLDLSEYTKDYLSAY